MAIATVVTRGYGNGTFAGSIALVVGHGFKSLPTDVPDDLCITFGQIDPTLAATIGQLDKTITMTEGQLTETIFVIDGQLGC